MHRPRCRSGITRPSSRTYSDSGSVPSRNSSSPASASASSAASAMYCRDSLSSWANPGTVRSMVSIDCIAALYYDYRSLDTGADPHWPASILELVGQPDAAAVRRTGRSGGRPAAGARRRLQLQALGDVELDACLRAARCALPWRPGRRAARCSARPPAPGCRWRRCAPPADPDRAPGAPCPADRRSRRRCRSASPGRRRSPPPPARRAGRRRCRTADAPAPRPAAAAARWTA